MFPDRTRRGEFPQRYLNPLVILFLGVLASTGHAFADTATLTWNGVSEASGYRISYGTASRNYTNTLDVGNNTQGTVTGLTSGTTYYFAVRAYDSSRISDFSQEVSGVVGGSSGGDTGGNSSGLVLAFGFDESSGTTVLDSSDAAGGLSDGFLSVGGSPSGPEWSADTPPFAGYAALTLTELAAGLPRVTSITASRKITFP